jgi:tetratricopeptide (TPR) repeat protein
MLVRLIGPAVLAAALVPGLANAQGGKAPAPAAAAAPAKGGVRKDPKGVKGISPFWESLKKGDDLYVARDFDGAIAAYREAIAKEPQNALGHYRMGEAQLAKADLQEAEASWVAALRFVGGDLALKAKILFVLADLRERQKSHDDAKERWTAYEQLAQKNPGVKTYPASAGDRKKRIDVWKKLLEDYSAVRKRIEQRLREADEKAKKSAGSS